MAWPNNWLRERADDLLARDRVADPHGYSDAYDNLLWAVATSERGELASLVGLLYKDPYINLPPSIQVTTLRFWGLELPADPERARDAIAIIAMYCAPGEEAGACGGLRQIIGRAGNPT